MLNFRTLEFYRQSSLMLYCKNQQTWGLGVFLAKDYRIQFFATWSGILKNDVSLVCNLSWHRENAKMNCQHFCVSSGQDDAICWNNPNNRKWHRSKQTAKAAPVVHEWLTACSDKMGKPFQCQVVIHFRNKIQNLALLNSLPHLQYCSLWE